MAVSCLLLGLFTPNVGILYSLVWTLWLCGSIVATPIIYRLVSSPSRFENRQLNDLWLKHSSPHPQSLRSCWPVAGIENWPKFAWSNKTFRYKTVEPRNTTKNICYFWILAFFRISLPFWQRCQQWFTVTAAKPRFAITRTKIVHW